MSNARAWPPRLAAGGWSAGLAVVLWMLHRAGGGDLAAPPLAHPTRFDDWLASVGLASAIIAVVRLLAMGLAWYLAVTTVLGTLARVSRARGVQRAVDAVTPAFVRHLLGSAGTVTAAGLTLAVGPLLAPEPHALETVPAHADSPPASGSSAAPDRQRQGQPAVLERIVATQLEAIDAPPDAEDPLRVAAFIALAQPPRPETWTVQTGDHLWRIAEDTLRDAWNRPVTDTETVDYWRVVIAANRDTLVVPDNPDLVYPGQIMVLPEPPPAPHA